MLFQFQYTQTENCSGGESRCFFIRIVFEQFQGLWGFSASGYKTMIQCLREHISNNFFQSEMPQNQKKSYLFYTSFHASRKWLEAGAASGRCDSQGHPMLVISMAGGVSDIRLNFTESQPVLPCYCPKRCFGVLGSPNMFWSPLLKVWKIMTSYRSVISFFLSLSAMMILNEHSGVDQ